MRPSREMDVRGRLGRFLSPGDLIMGRRVHKVVVEDNWVEVTFDTNDVIHVHPDDYIDVDLPGKDATWIRVQPDIDDRDGRLVGWTLVLELDSDWQRWSVHAEGGKQEFRVDLSDSDLFALAMATSLPITMQALVEEGVTNGQ